MIYDYVNIFLVVTFYISDNYRSKQWVINCHREDLLTKDATDLYKNCKLCAKHFSDSCFHSTLKNRLHDTAVPTLFFKNINVKRRRFDNIQGT